MNAYTFPSAGPGELTVIIGLGETGLAAALWCLRHGGRVRILDTRPEPPGLDMLRARADQASVDYRLGSAAFEVGAVHGAGRIVVSPGLAPGHEPVRTLLGRAAEQGVEIIGEIELFARALADMGGQGYTPQVLAITGTNGKTTVTAMTRQLVQAAGRSVQAAGNIGPAALTALQRCLDAGELPDVWVVELSSFQLATTHSLAAHAATVLNISQDHLDWHDSFEEYAAAKARIFEHARYVVLNRDDARVRSMVADAGATMVRTFGSDLPQLEGDMGMEISNGLRWLASCESLDFEQPAPRARRRPAAAPVRGPGRLVRLMPADAMRVRGKHNALNAMAALLLTRSLGLGWADMLGAVREYRGEPHRTEFIRSIENVDFIDDSKGTNVGAAVAALAGLERRAVLIAGGLGKGQDFVPLADAVAQHAHAVVLIGRDAPVLAQAMGGAGVPIETAASLEAAVHRAYQLAEPGMAVLLSPACASMDMFRDYRERGAAFAQAVQGLAAERGEWA